MQLMVLLCYNCITMKRTVFFLIMAWVVAGMAASALSPAAEFLSVASAGGKKIEVAFGRLRRVIDLDREVSGCTELYDPAEPSGRIHDSARIGVIDWVYQNRKHYLVLWTLANANCNVQGHCGAGEDCTLVWLRLDESLKPEKRQALVVQECRAETGIPELDLEFPGKHLCLADGKLEVKFGDLISETPAWTHVLYEHDACENGLIVNAP